MEIAEDRLQNLVICRLGSQSCIWLVDFQYAFFEETGLDIVLVMAGCSYLEQYLQLWARDSMRS